MNYVILDLEWNGSYSKKQKRYVNEIIEFGAVKVNENLEIIDTFSIFVTQQIGKRLNSHVSKLTHITNEQLIDSHNTFTHALSKFRKFMGDSVLLTWGINDLLALMENCEYYLCSKRIDFVTKYCNLQAYCEKVLDLADPSKQLGLNTCAEALDINLDEIDMHRAINDAKLSLMCLQKIYDMRLLRQMTDIAATDKFYNKITFKSFVITDIESPAIDKSVMFFDCDSCNMRAVRKTKWKIKNKSFRADFICPCCGKKFVGRIIFKQKYDCVSVNKKIMEKTKIK